MVVWIGGRGVEHSTEGVELPLHVDAITADPCVDLAEWFGGQAVMTKASYCALFNEAGTLQDREVLADRGLRHVERSDEIGDVALAKDERVEERAPPGGRDCVKDAFMNRRALHRQATY